MAPTRTFLMVANRADPSGEVPLADLAGAGGRFDVVTRFVTASLLTSHGIREDTRAIVLFTAPDGPPVALRVDGGSVIGLRPDERSTAAKLNEALGPAAMPVWQPTVDGFKLRTIELEELLDELPEPVVWLVEDGEPLSAGELSEGSFVVGDQDGLTDAQRSLLAKRADRRASVGPLALQADQVVTLVHDRLDRT